MQNLTDLDRLSEILGAEEMASLNKDLAAVKDNRGQGREVFLKAVAKLNERLDKEKQEQMERVAKAATGGEKAGASHPWSNDELALLIKAVNLFPAGTTNRWEVVASFVNQHTKSSTAEAPPPPRTAKETLSKAKALQQGDFSKSALKEEVNKNALENLEKQKKRDVKVDDAEASKRTETAAEAMGLNVEPWTPDEQKMLEQALKTYPASLGTERWDKIADCLPNRSRKDCMRRYKELAELIRAKKAAQAAAKTSAAKK